MTVGLKIPQHIYPVPGVRLASAQAGIRYKNRADVLLIETAAGSQCAAVFTRNSFAAAPVLLAREHLAEATPRYLLVNAGNANAATGDAGLAAALRCCELVAQQAGVSTCEVLPYSTGVIGEVLPTAPFEKVMPELLQNLHEQSWLDAAKTIMTTDTVPKVFSKRYETTQGSFTLTGMVKGSGMIAPNMATMLAYLATDVQCSQEHLQQLLMSSVDKSFNCITVDGDTSTNDAVTLIASGAAGVDVSADEELAGVFAQALDEACLFLAQAVIRDGEGITKFVTVEVNGATHEVEAHQVAMTVANSPLVKTALFASDPNWGRIVMAIGRADVAGLDVNKVNVYLGDTRIVYKGGRDADYEEAMGQREMDKDEILIRIELGRARASCTVWTCDFSHEYVRINAEYRS